MEMKPKVLLAAEPFALKEALAIFLSPSCDFYSDPAQRLIEEQLAKHSGIGPATANRIYLRAVNGTYLR